MPNTIPLDMEIHHLSVPPYTVQQKKDSRARLVALDTAELARQKKSEAHNMLEGYLYRLRDLLDGEEVAPFILYSKPEERKNLKIKLDEAFAWFNENGEDAETAEMWAQRDALEYVPASGLTL